MVKCRVCLIVAAMLILNSLLAACDSVEPMQKSKPSPKAAEADKYTAYMKLDLFIAGKLTDGLTYYFDKFGEDEELAADSHTSLSNGIFWELNKRDLEGVGDYATMEPGLEGVDSLITEMYPKLQELIRLLEEADLYYKMKSHVDDHLVKGKELHRQIVAQSRETEALLSSFATELAERFAEKSRQELDKLDSRQSVRASALRMILSAMELEKELARQDITADTVAKLDLAKYKEAYAELVKHTNAYLEVSKDAGQLKEEKLDESLAYANEFTISVMNTKAAATDILTRAEAEKKSKDGAAADIVREGKAFGTPELFSKKMKEMIIHYLAAFDSEK